MSIEAQAFLCQDETTEPVDVLQFFVRRWSLEMSFAEVRRHLYVETRAFRVA